MSNNFFLNGKKSADTVFTAEKYAYKSVWGNDSNTELQRCSVLIHHFIWEIEALALLLVHASGGNGVHSTYVYVPQFPPVAPQNRSDPNLNCTYNVGTQTKKTDSSVRRETHPKIYHIIFFLLFFFALTNEIHVCHSYGRKHFSLSLYLVNNFPNSVLYLTKKIADVVDQTIHLWEKCIDSNKTAHLQHIRRGSRLADFEY